MDFKKADLISSPSTPSRPIPPGSIGGDCACEDESGDE